MRVGRGSALSVVLSGVFLITLFSPLIQQVFTPFNLERFQLAELKERQVFPRFSWGRLNQFPESFDRYFQKNFGFRDLLVRIQNTVRFSLFNVSGTSEVMVGKEGWLFHTNDDSVKYFQGANLFNAKELETLKQVYETRYQYLRGLGIHYILMIVPSKETIYSEFYPDHIKKVSNLNRYDQLLSYLRTNSAVPILDIKQHLLQSKARGELYRKRDGHWNRLGGFVAYEVLHSKLRELFPQLLPLSFDQYVVETKTEVGELGRMLGLLRDEHVPTLFVKSKQPDPWLNHFVEDREVGKPLIIDRSHKIRGKLGLRDSLAGKLMVYRDSFFFALTPFIAEHFAWSAYYTTHKYVFDPYLIEQNMPDVVIDQQTERLLKVPKGKELPLLQARISGKKLSELGKIVRKDESVLAVNGRYKIPGGFNNGSSRYLIVLNLQSDLLHNQLNVRRRSKSGAAKFIAALPIGVEQRVSVFESQAISESSELELSFRYPERGRILSLEIRELTAEDSKYFAPKKDLAKAGAAPAKIKNRPKKGKKIAKIKAKRKIEKARQKATEQAL